MRAFALLIAPVALLAMSVGVSAQDTPGGVQAKNKAVDGAKVYKQICAACHLPAGQGAGAIPALARNKKLANPAYPIGILKKGKGAMPPMGDMLSASQMAAVITHVRTSFGNAYPQPVTEADVKRLGK